MNFKLILKNNIKFDMILEIMKLFLLSKANIDIAKNEVLSLTGKKTYELYDDILIIDSKDDFHDRLGYCHAVYEFLFKVQEKDLEKNIKKFDWNKVYKKNFYVKTVGNNTAKKLSSIIYEKLDKPIVEVRNPKTEIVFFYKEDTVFVALLLNKVDKSYLKRKAHLRPELHPTSLHPGLARACINLTGLSKGKLLDPFCGSGGILIEAGIMGFDITGYDLEKTMITKARKNLDYYNLNSNVKQKDALKIKGNYDCIVTDLPYGKNSKASDISKLYSSFLRNSEKLTNNMIIIFPDFVDAKKLIGESNWRIKNKFSVYVHKSMTRIIFKLVLSHH